MGISRLFSTFLCRAARLAIGLSAAALPVAAGAQALPDPTAIAQADEQEVARDLLALMQSNPTDAYALLPVLDGFLARLNGPTPLRGLVQMMRASALMDTPRNAQAIAAIDEAVRRLPDQAVPLAMASVIYTMADQPELGLDYLIRASRVAPDMVRQIPTFELTSLVTRLRQRADDRRLGLLAERLFEIDWIGTDATLRSSLARSAIQSRMRADDIAGARSMLPHLLAPSDARAMLIDNAYRDIWGDIERWTGPRQERQWQTYLRGIEAGWEASRDPQYAATYARALRAAGHDNTLLAQMLPLLTQVDRDRDYMLIWVVPIVGTALARQGRIEDVRALYRRMAETWPMGSDGNALNIAANRYAFELDQGEFATALRGIDAVIADSNGRAGDVSAGALAQMHVVRICALTRLGRQAEAAPSIAFVLREGPFRIKLDALLCLDRMAEARAMILARLEEEDMRQNILELLQPPSVREPTGPHQRMMEERLQQLRDDPELRHAAGRFGRILSYPPNAGAPPEHVDAPLDPAAVI